MTQEFKVHVTFNDNGPADVLYIWAKSADEAASKGIAKYSVEIIETVYCIATGIKAGIKA